MAPRRAAQAEWDAFARGADAPCAPGRDSHLESLPLFQRIASPASWDGAHQFLLDNRTHAGVPGYEVLTPLRLSG